MDLTNRDRRLIQAASASSAKGDRRLRTRATIGLIFTLLAAAGIIVSLFLGQPDLEDGVTLYVALAMVIGVNLIAHDSTRFRARTNALIRKLSHQLDLGNKVQAD